MDLSETFKTLSRGCFGQVGLTSKFLFRLYVCQVVGLQTESNLSTFQFAVSGFKSNISDVLKALLANQ